MGALPAGSFRVGLFTTDFPFSGPFASNNEMIDRSQWGGVAEVVYQIAMRLNDQGHTIKVFAASPLRNDIVQEYEGITVYRYSRSAQVGSTILSQGLLWNPLQHELDIVHGHLGTPPGAFAALLYSKLRRRPLITTVHTSYNDVSLRGGSSARRLALTFFMRGVCSPLLTASDMITAVSEPVMRESPAFREHRQRATIVPNGIDIGKARAVPSKEECRRRLSIHPDEKIVLYVGSLSEYKDPRTLLLAFSDLHAKEPPSRLVLIGDGPLKPELWAEAERRGIGDVVDLPGFVSEEEKLLHYGAADVFAIPSLGDTFGLVVLEAAAFGKPIVASDIDVFRGLMVDGKEGLFFKRGDAADLALKLERLLSDEGLRESVGVSARSLAERYEWDGVMGRYLSIYHSLVTGNGLISDGRGR